MARMHTRTEPRWLDQDQQRAWRTFLRGTSQALGAIEDDLQRREGFSLSEYEVLVRLSEASGRTLRMSALAQHLVHSRSRLTHTVGRLERAGYVVREPCPEDRRGVNCCLTDAGFARLAAMAPGHVESVRAHIVDRLTDEQMRQLGEIMAVLAEPAAGGEPAGQAGVPGAADGTPPPRR